MGYFIHEDQPAGLPLANVDQLNDVNITSPADKDVLSYDATSQKWVNDGSINSAITNCIKYINKSVNTDTGGNFTVQFASGVIPLTCYVGSGLYAFMRGYDSQTNTYTYFMGNYQSNGTITPYANQSGRTVYFFTFDVS